jgi:hypothetical protein
MNNAENQCQSLDYHFITWGDMEAIPIHRIMTFVAGSRDGELKQSIDLHDF